MKCINFKCAISEIVEVALDKGRQNSSQMGKANSQNFRQTHIEPRSSATQFDKLIFHARWLSVPRLSLSSHKTYFDTIKHHKWRSALHMSASFMFDFQYWIGHNTSLETKWSSDLFFQRLVGHEIKKLWNNFNYCLFWFCFHSQNLHFY